VVALGGTNLLPKAVPPTALEMTRMIATCRVVLPATMVRLSAGRMGFSQGEQTLMFLAGANSIFYGEQLLTTPNPEVSRTEQMAVHNTRSTDEYN
jgi:biotin synthase